MTELNWIVAITAVCSFIGFITGWKLCAIERDSIAAGEPNEHGMTGL